MVRCRSGRPGISARFNLACSGGQPYDLASASNTRTNGRNVAAQPAQLRAVARTHDIDVAQPYVEEDGCVRSGDGVVITG